MAETLEREVKDILFQQKKSVNIHRFEGGDPIETKRVNLLAVSNKYGLTVLGGEKDFRVCATLKLLAPTDGYAGVSVPLPSSGLCNLAFSCDELCLSACCFNNDMLNIQLYDIRAISKSKVNSSFCEVSVPSQLVDFRWHPEEPNRFAAVFADGGIALYDVVAGDDGTRSISRAATLPPGSGVTCLCWSPKGKQFVVGKNAGHVEQYGLACELKKTHGCPAAGMSAVCDVTWYSTHEFFVVYDRSPADDTRPAFFALLGASKKGGNDKPVWTNFDDIYYGFGGARSHFTFHAIPEWNMVLSSSARSLEVAAVGRGASGAWQHWTLDDTGRAELPLNGDDEQYPVGMALDTTSAANVEIDDKTLPPAPVLMVYSSMGMLCPYSLVSKRSDLPTITGPCQKRPAMPSQLQGQAAPKAAAPATQSQGTFVLAANLAQGRATAAATAAQPGAPFALGQSTPRPPAVAGAGGLAQALSSASPQQASATPATPQMASAPAGQSSASSLKGGLFSKPLGSPAPGGSLFASAGQGATPTAQLAAAPAGQTASPALSLKGGLFSKPATTAPATGSAFAFGQGATSTPLMAPAAAGQPSVPALSLKSGLSSKPAATAPPAAPTGAMFAGAGQAAALPPQMPAVPAGQPSAAPPSLKGGLFSAAPTGSMFAGAGQAAALPPQMPAGQPSAAPPSLKGGLFSAAPTGSPFAAAATTQPGAAAAAAATLGQSAPKPPATAAAAGGLGQALSSAPAQHAPATAAPPLSRPLQQTQPAMSAQLGKPAVAGLRLGAAKPAGGQPAAPVAHAQPAAPVLNVRDQLYRFGQEMQELDDYVRDLLSSKSSKSSLLIGDQRELGELRAQVNQLSDTLMEFDGDRKRASQQANELREGILDSHSRFQEAEVLQRRFRDPQQLKLLRSRPLDSSLEEKNAERLKSARQIKRSIMELNGVLDQGWQQQQQSAHTMREPALADVYKALKAQRHTIINQAQTLGVLQQKMGTANKTSTLPVYTSTPAAAARALTPVSTPRRDHRRSQAIDESSVALEATATPAANELRAKQLRVLLSQRTAVPMRQNPVCAWSASCEVSHAATVAVGGTAKPLSAAAAAAPAPSAVPRSVQQSLGVSAPPGGAGLTKAAASLSKPAASLSTVSAPPQLGGQLAAGPANLTSLPKAPPVAFKSAAPGQPLTGVAGSQPPLLSGSQAPPPAYSQFAAAGTHSSPPQPTAAPGGRALTSPPSLQGPPPAGLFSKPVASTAATGSLFAGAAKAAVPTQQTALAPAGQTSALPLSSKGGLFSKQLVSSAPAGPTFSFGGQAAASTPQTAAGPPGQSSTSPPPPSQGLSAGLFSKLTASAAPTGSLLTGVGQAVNTAPPTTALSTGLTSTSPPAMKGLFSKPAASTAAPGSMFMGVGQTAAPTPRSSAAPAGQISASPPSSQGPPAGLFSKSGSSTAPAGSLFGAVQAATSTPQTAAVPAGQTSASPPSLKGGLFAKPAASTAASAGSLLGAGQAATSTPLTTTAPVVQTSAASQGPSAGLFSKSTAATGSLFAGADKSATATPQTTAGLFGNASTSPPSSQGPATGLFSKTAATTGSLLAGTGQAATSTASSQGPATGLFSKSVATTGSLLAGTGQAATSTTSSQGPAAGLFSKSTVSPAASGSLFAGAGQASSTTPPKDAPPAVRASTSPPASQGPSAGLFSKTAASTAGASSLFGFAGQAATTSTTAAPQVTSAGLLSKSAAASLFGGSGQGTTTSSQGPSTGLFSNPPASTAAAGSLFGGAGQAAASTTSSQGPSPGLFSKSPSGSLFGAAGQAATSTTAAASQSNPPSGLFSKPAASSGGVPLFGGSSAPAGNAGGGSLAPLSFSLGQVSVAPDTAQPQSSGPPKKTFAFASSGSGGGSSGQPADVGFGGLFLSPGGGQQSSTSISAPLQQSTPLPQKPAGSSILTAGSFALSPAASSAAPQTAAQLGPFSTPVQSTSSPFGAPAAGASAFGSSPTLGAGAAAGGSAFGGGAAFGGGPAFGGGSSFGSGPSLNAGASSGQGFGGGALFGNPGGQLQAASPPATTGYKFGGGAAPAAAGGFGALAAGGGGGATGFGAAAAAAGGAPSGVQTGFGGSGPGAMNFGGHRG